MASERRRHQSQDHATLVSLGETPLVENVEDDEESSTEGNEELVRTRPTRGDATKLYLYLLPIPCSSTRWTMD